MTAATALRPPGNRTPSTPAPARTHSIVDSPLGALTLVADGATLVGLYFADHRYPLDSSRLGSRTRTPPEAAERQLDEYFAGHRRDFDLELAPRGDGFHQRVWTLLDRIPYGTTTTYGDLAAELGDRRLARAVGGAVGHNPLSLLAPCHRVVAGTGALTGYAGGLARKRRLLDLEARVVGGHDPLW